MTGQQRLRRAPVRTAVVGLGWMGRQVCLPALCDDPAFEVSALVDPDPAARSRAARQAPGARACASVLDIGPDVVDLAVLTVPNHLHAEMAEGILGRGVSVFVEKPVCLSSSELARLRIAESRSGGVLLAGTAGRHRADVRALRSVTPTLAPIRLVTLSWVRARGIPRQGGWFCRSDRAGGGALIDLGWHLLDVALDLVGSPAIAQACAVTSADFLGDARWSAGWRQDAPRPGGRQDVEDSAAGFLVTTDGMGISLRTAWASHQERDRTVITFDGARGSASLRCTFGFSPARERGSRLVVQREGRSELVPLADEEIGVEYRRQLGALPALLRDRAARGRALAEARPVVAAIEALYEAAGSAPRAAHRSTA